MRRTTLQLLFLFGLGSLPIAAQETIESIVSSYSIAGCRYWFDNATQVTQADYASGKIALDVSALEEGFHTLHYQILDSRGEVSPARTAPFFRLQPTEEKFKDYAIQTVRYWFDKDYTPREVAYVSGTSAIDVSALEEGFHTLHYQVIDSKGETSPSRTSSFFRIPSEDEQFKDYTIQTVRYWFDKDYTPREVAYVSGTSDIDVSALEEGFHTLHYQVIDSKGETSPSRTSSFFRIPSEDEQFKDYTIQTVRYWFDKEYTPREVAYASGTSAIDVSALEEGFHTLHYQVIDSKGETSPSRTAPFFRLQPTEEKFKDYAVQTVSYWVDNDTTTMQTEAFVSGQTTLNLSGLPEGIHTLCYQVKADDGQVSPVRSASIDRWLYDIYVSDWTEYSDSIVGSRPLFASRPDLKLHHLPTDVNVRGHLTVSEGTTLSLGKFVQTANWGHTIYTDNKYIKPGSSFFHITTLLNDGQMRADSVIVKQSLYRDCWHFLSLPFNANVSDIGVPSDTYYALRQYDGEARALGEMTDTWTNLRGGDQMEAGRGYIVQLTRESGDKTAELTFKAVNDPQKNNIFTTQDVTTPLEEHQAEFAHNRSWNLVGNPYPSFYDSRYIDHDGTIIVWNGNGYSAYSLSDDEYVLMPFEAFFIQKPLSSDALTFSKDGRQHSADVGAGVLRGFEIPVPARRLSARQASRRVLNFMLTDAGEDACAPVAADLQSDATEYKDLQSATLQDRTRVVINEQASIDYEQDKDAPKFMEARPQTAQLMSVEGGVQYAINERPLGDGQIVFSVYAPAAGEYRFSLVGDASERHNAPSVVGDASERHNDPSVVGDASERYSDPSVVGDASERYSALTVLDTETGTVWPLSDGDYLFTATEGMHPARLIVSLTGEATAIAQVNAYSDGEVKVSDGQLSFSFLRVKHVRVFGLDGRLLFSDATDHARVKVAHGVYLVDIDGKTTKIMVK